MKKVINLGRGLSKSEQKKITGGYGGDTGQCSGVLTPFVCNAGFGCTLNCNGRATSGYCVSNSNGCYCVAAC